VLEAPRLQAYAVDRDTLEAPLVAEHRFLQGLEDLGVYFALSLFGHVDGAVVRTVELQRLVRHFDERLNSEFWGQWDLQLDDTSYQSTRTARR
jgi:hypothetical protein